ncbi:pilin [Patescibacteria group bacterium]|nr:pilin [Patescibacteria group bacterium]
MSNKNKKIFIVAALLFVALLPPLTHALDLQLYSSPPCLLTDVYGTCNASSSLNGYIQLLYRFGLGIGGILAVGMIVWGSILISISGSVDKEREGRDFITSALFGLALLFGAYLILNQINPNLVQLVPPSAPFAPAPAVPGGQMSPDMYASNAANLQTLESAGVGVSSTGGCYDAYNAKCTSLADMPSNAIDFLVGLKKACNCDITVTGGTEVGHVSHGLNKPVFDLRTSSALVTYIQNNLNRTNGTLDGTHIDQICTTSANSNIRYNCSNYSESEEHIHISLSGN